MGRKLVSGILTSDLLRQTVGFGRTCNWNLLVEVCIATYDTFMQHVLMTFCLIASLLACPLRCAACHSSSSAIEQAQQNKRTCQCCAKKAVCPEESESSLLGGKRPADPAENDCSCANCICEGATLTKAPDFASHIIEGLVDHRVDAVLGQLLHTADFSCSEICIESLPPADIQAALALRQSWCI